MKRIQLAALLLIAIATPSLFAGGSKKESNLPKVLIIGDSISLGYTPVVAKLLKGKAIVKHNKGNAGDTGRGLKNIDAWIGKTKWDVIHFNWGLWDLCYRHPDSKAQGKRDKVKGTVTSTLETYEKHLDELVRRLKKTGATLIWANVTVVPEKETGRIVGDDLKYNEVAAKVMKKHGIPINDLHSLTKSFSAELFQKPGDVHYKKDGYKKIGKQVAEKILVLLAEKSAPSKGEK